MRKRMIDMPRAAAGSRGAWPQSARPPRAQSDYPNRPIQLVVPYGPGGVADVGMRIMAEKLSVRLKQNVVIENRPAPPASSPPRPSRPPRPMATTC